MRQRDRVLSFGKLLQLVALTPEDRDIHRQIVAIHQLDLKKHQLRPRHRNGNRYQSSPAAPSIASLRGVPGTGI